MTEKLKIIAPVKFSMIVSITDGERNAQADYQFAAGSTPTPADVEEGINAVLASAKEISPNFRLMTKKEFWDELCVEKTGTTFAIPGGEEWEK